MHRRTAIAVLALATLLLPATAAAHVELSPDHVPPGSFTLFSVLSPNENGQPLTGLRLVIPDGLEVDAPADTPGFTTTVIEDARHRTAALSWQGGRIAPGHLGIFRFSGSVGATGTLQATGVQTFADGSTRTWHTPVLTVAAESSGRDGLTLGLGAAALVLSAALLVGCAAVLLRRKRAEV